NTIQNKVNEKNETTDHRLCCTYGGETNIANHENYVFVHLLILPAITGYDVCTDDHHHGCRHVFNGYLGPGTKTNGIFGAVNVRHRRVGAVDYHEDEKYAFSAVSFQVTKKSTSLFFHQGTNHFY